MKEKISKGLEHAMSMAYLVRAMKILSGGFRSDAFDDGGLRLNIAPFHLKKKTVGS